MCGFTVIFKKNNNFQINEKKFLNSSSLISHRGPDDFSSYKDEKIYMNFYRLSIFDLSLDGRQPMVSFSGRYLIVFNGAIYNKDDLKEKINKENLLGTSDTEILLNCYEKFGEKILDFLEGMFSFIIYDKKTKKIFAARDAFGIKPLYYYETKDYFYFSSEIKPIIKYSGEKEISNNSVYNFFINQEMDSFNQTFFLKIKSLSPSSCISISPNGNKKIKKYWSIINNAITANDYKNKKEIISHIKSLFEDSLNKHLKADVDIGMFLSGGTDSTSIAAISKKFYGNLKTFTYDFAGSYKGEIDDAKKTSSFLGYKNFHYYLKIDDVLQNIENLTYILESPFTSIRLIADFKLYKICKKKNTKVILLGHGGDELLGGYKYNQPSFLLDKYLKEKNYKSIGSNFKDFSVIMNQNSFTKDCTPYLFEDNFDCSFINSNEKKLNTFFGLNFLKSSQLVDINHINLPRSLKYADRLSMSQGVESRLPFLDRKLSKYLFNLPNDYKMYKDVTRWIFKEYAVKYIDKKFFKSQKRAIADPQREWFKKEFKDFFMDIFNSQSFASIEYFNSNNIKKNYMNLINGKTNTSFNLFQIITFYFFYQKFKKF